MKTYTVKPEFIDQFGADLPADGTITEGQIAQMLECYPESERAEKETEIRGMLI